MSLAAILLDLLLFFFLVFGLGLPCVLTSRFGAAEKLALGAATGLFHVYVFAWLAYWLELPRGFFFLLPAAALVASALFWRKLGGFLADPDVQGLLGRQLIFAGWCIGWLALVRSYGGGEWSADWYEHYKRAVFFLQRMPLGTTFLQVYSLPARPPLANLVDGTFMAMGGVDFAHFQLFNTLGSTLVFLPAVLLGRHFARDGRRIDAVLLLMLMLNPLVLQNATYSWTKLLCAFYILLAIAFYARGLAENDATRRTVAIAAIAAGLLAHYSAGPYAVGLAGAGIALAWSRRHSFSAWRELALQGLLSAGLLATWFAWSIAKYDVTATFSSNTTATGAAGTSFSEWVGQWAWNIFVTLVPHPFHPVEYLYIGQTSRLGFARDYLFNIYQTTLPGAFGLAGLVLLAWALTHRRASSGSVAERWFWRCFPASVFLLGIATASWRDRWGVAHICLPALIITGLTWLAARFQTASAMVRRIWVFALMLDLVLGISLHFFLQATISLPESSVIDLTQGKVLEYSQMAAKNLMLKFFSASTFVADRAPAPILILAFLVLLLALAGRQLPGLGAAPGSRSNGEL